MEKPPLTLKKRSGNPYWDHYKKVRTKMGDDSLKLVAI